MKLTIGMACYKDFDQAWFTVQALRVYQDLADTEILLMDNFGDDRLKGFVDSWTQGQARYVRWTDVQGSAPAKGRVFAEARGDFVVCIDPHVLLWPGSVARLREWVQANPDYDGLVHGPLWYDHLQGGCDAIHGGFGGDGLWGTWRGMVAGSMEQAPYPIEKMGMGCFGCRRDKWLGFAAGMKGFGGEEGLIHRKYVKAGRQTLLLPFLRWVHLFRDNKAPPYPAFLEDKVRNTLLGFLENGDDPAPVLAHFGDMAKRILGELKKAASQTTTSRPVSQLTSSRRDMYDDVSAVPSDIVDHLPALARLGAGKRVVEFGVRDGNSTAAFLKGRPTSLVSYDLNPCSREQELRTYAKSLNVPFDFRLGDSRSVDVGEVDVLFIDTIHTGWHLREELLNSASKVRERIVLHDTETFGEVGQDGSPGLITAVIDLMAAGEWETEVHYKNCHGLTVLRRNQYAHGTP